MGSAEKNAKFEALFRAAGLKFKEVNAFGSHLIVTCWSQNAARRIASLLQRSTFTVDRVGESIDYNEENRVPPPLPRDPGQAGARLMTYTPEQ
ncbi:MAG TPA: hypothetical protein VD930_13815, partial [Gemmatimonadales bacterium]|nr:hypothetical protein [Gemmatimonadales bacterium]